MDVTPAGPHQEAILPKMDQRSDKSDVHSSSDIEKQAAAAPEAQLQRKLSSRHLQFVAIGTHINWVDSCSFANVT